MGLFKQMLEMGGIKLSQYMDLVNLQSKDTSNFTIIPTNKVSVWNDAISAWNQTTDINRPLLTGGSVVFDGSNDQLIRTSEISATSFSIYIVFKNTSGLDKIFLGAQSASDYFIHDQPAGRYDSFNLSIGGVPKQIFRLGLKGNRVSILSIRRNGNVFTAKLNDRNLISTSALFAGQPTLISRLMSYVGGGYNTAGSVKALCISSQALSDDLDKQVINKLYSDYNLTTETAIENVVGFGDSNTVGQTSASYLVALASSLGVSDANAGISGSLLTGTGANTGVVRYQKDIITRPYTDYVVIQYGTNDVLANVTAATYGAALNTVVGGLISAGYSANKICLVSTPYQQSNANSALLDAYRTQTISVKNTYGTKYFDLLQDMRDNGGDSLMTDTVHYGATANARMKDGVYLALTT